MISKIGCCKIGLVMQPSHNYSTVYSHPQDPVQVQLEELKGKVDELVRIQQRRYASIVSVSMGSTV